MTGTLQKIENEYKAQQLNELYNQENKEKIRNKYYEQKNYFKTKGVYK